MADEANPQPRRSFMAEHPIRSSDSVQYLSDDEIKQFIDALDHNGDGHIDYAEIERKLDEAHDQLAPEPKKHNVVKRNHDSHDDKVRHEFLRSMMGNADQGARIPRDDFARLVKEWKIPSLKQAKKEEENEKSYFKRLASWRRIRAYWAVHGPEIAFIGLVVSMQLAFGIWQLVKYLTVDKYQDALGWGVVLAKTCAGALYPTFFFLILSMSRYLSTFLRRSYIASRFFNWDLSHEFHIRISCVAIVLATLHAIGHLTGSIRSLSNPANEEAVARLLGDSWVPLKYSDMVTTLPGITGVLALFFFYVLSLLSIPQVRRWNYEVFQLGHLLMFPIIGLMMAHGAAALFQWPMFGYFLAFPTLLVLIERSIRVCLGFHRIKATLKVLDADTVEIAAVIPSERLWKYNAGQYIFLQVPKLSFFQWHPFTVSFCRGNRMMVHIKTDGNWTERLRDLGGESGEAEIEVGINGPFGAPAQRFYDFNHSLIIGAGIGVTPFSGILADLQYKDNQDHGGPSHLRPTPEKKKSTSSASAATLGAQEKNENQQNGDSNGNQPEEEQVTRAQNTQDGPVDSSNFLQPPPNRDSVSANHIDQERKPQPQHADTFADDYRRVDFHWMVRDRNYLLWLSDLLNEVSTSQEWHREHEDKPHLDIRINTHVTAKHKDISTHVYRWLLEMHRTDEHPASPLTGLLNPTHFGRPEFDVILDEHYEEMLRFRARTGRRESVSSSSSSSSQASSAGEVGVAGRQEEELKVGVFYCGAPVVGEILADKCRQLTERGRRDGSKIEYHFMIEVFG
ncbi:FAD-binding domain-containing protein [Sarocladium implicatum]|nr:FAD-binding domain-containing protein [Sarocladium implicatum]